jgi:hypothetical protein
VLEAVMEESDDELEQSVISQAVPIPKIGDRVLDYIAQQDDKKEREENEKQAVRTIELFVLSR